MGFNHIGQPGNPGLHGDQQPRHLRLDAGPAQRPRPGPDRPGHGHSFHRGERQGRHDQGDPRGPVPEEPLPAQQRRHQSEQHPGKESAQVRRIVHRGPEGDGEVDEEVDADRADDALADGLRQALADAQVEPDRRSEQTEDSAGGAGRQVRVSGLEAPERAGSASSQRGRGEEAERDVRSEGQLELRREDPDRVGIHQQVKPADVQQRVRTDPPEIAVAHRGPVEGAQTEKGDDALHGRIAPHQRLGEEGRGDHEEQRPGRRPRRPGGRLRLRFDLRRRRLRNAAERIDHSALSTAARSFFSTSERGPTAQATRFSLRKTALATRRTSAAVTRSTRDSQLWNDSAGGRISSPAPNHPIISAGESRENSSQMRDLFFARISSSPGTSVSRRSASTRSISAIAAGDLRGAQAQPTSKTEQSLKPSMPAPTEYASALRSTRWSCSREARPSSSRRLITRRTGKSACSSGGARNETCTSIWDSVWSTAISCGPRGAPFSSVSPSASPGRRPAKCLCARSRTRSWRKGPAAASTRLRAPYALACWARKCSSVSAPTVSRVPAILSPSGCPGNKARLERLSMSMSRPSLSTSSRISSRMTSRSNSTSLNSGRASMSPSTAIGTSSRSGCNGEK